MHQGRAVFPPKPAREHVAIEPTVNELVLGVMARRRAAEADHVARQSPVALAVATVGLVDVVLYGWLLALVVGA